MLPPVRPAVLLVDDDATLLSVLSRRVSRAGYEVRTAASGSLALKQLEGSWPALMVVDLMMPGMDGFTLTQHIQANPHFGGARIALLTSGALRADAGLDRASTELAMVELLSALLEAS